MAAFGWKGLRATGEGAAAPHHPSHSIRFQRLALPSAHDAQPERRGIPGPVRARVAPLDHSSSGSSGPATAIMLSMDRKFSNARFAMPDAHWFVAAPNQASIRLKLS